MTAGPRPAKPGHDPKETRRTSPISSAVGYESGHGTNSRTTTGRSGARAPLVLVVTAAVVLGLTAFRFIVWEVLDAPAWWVTEASVWVVPVLGAAFLLRTPAGRRACALLSAAFAPIAATVFLGDAIMAPTVRVAFSLVVVPFAVLAMAGAASYTVRKIGDNAVQRAAERGPSGLTD